MTKKSQGIAGKSHLFVFIISVSKTLRIDGAAFGITCEKWRVSRFGCGYAALGSPLAARLTEPIDL